MTPLGVWAHPLFGGVGASSVDWGSLAPLSLDLALVAGIVLVLLVDLFQPAEQGSVAGPLSAILLGFLFAGSFFVDTSGSVFGGSYVGGPWPLFFKRVVLAAAFLAVLGGLDFVRERYARREGEYYLLVLFSVLGMTLLPGARDLILFVVCFELMGLPLSVLAAYGKTELLGQAASVPGRGRRVPTAPEAGMKLYLVGAASTSITLFGLSLVVGVAGTTDLAQLSGAPASPLFLAGMTLVLAGIGYKLGLVPFHMWIPDTYEGAGTPFVAFLSVASKAAAFAAVVLLFVVGFAQAEVVWLRFVLVLAALTMVVGNLLALAQTNVKRLLGYSGVAHAGYLMMGVLAWETNGLAMLLFYLAAYVVTNIGAFLVVEAVARDGEEDGVAHFNGLAQRSPWLGMAMLLFLLSLAGIPFVVGFWAKLYVFLAAWEAGYAWLVVLGVVLAVVGLFYYLQIARAIYMVRPDLDHAEPIRPGFGLTAAVLACLVGVVALGLWPGPLLAGAEAAAAALR